MSIKPSKYKWESWSDFLELRDFVVVDMVTTGQSPEKEKIIELGMIKVADGNVIGKFYSLMNPGKPIPTRIENATGITDYDVATASTFGECLEDVVRFVQDSVVVAPNASTAAKFLAKEIGDCGQSTKFTYFDFDSLAQKAFPMLENYKLGDLVQYLGLDVPGLLRARDGAEAVLQIVQQIYNNYDSALARAVGRCCSPIVDYCFDYCEAYPLAGKRVAILGDLTFSASNARKLVEAAGGVLDAKLSKDTDILVYGFVDPNKHPKWMEPAIKKAQYAFANGGAMEAINEVGLLKKCGASLFLGSEHNSQEKERDSLDDVLLRASERSDASKTCGFAVVKGLGG